MRELWVKGQKEKQREKTKKVLEIFDFQNSLVEVRRLELRASWSQTKRSTG